MRHAPPLAALSMGAGFVWDPMLYLSMTILAAWLIGFAARSDRW